MAAFRASSVFLFIALTACSVGEVPIGGNPGVDAPGVAIDAPPVSTIDGPASTIDAPPVGNDPAATFASIVTPIVNEDLGGKHCAQAGCHSGATPPDLSSYAKLADMYKVKPGMSNILVTHGVHSGPALPTLDAKKIAMWIDSLP
jgi:hypothetical protein